MIKSILLLCALVALVHAQGYAYQVNFISGTNCANPATNIVDIKYYRTNQCSYYNNIAYDANSPSVIVLSQYPNKDCTGGTAPNTINLGQCIQGTGGSARDYYWNYTSSLSSTLVPGYVTYTTFGQSGASRCTNPVMYVTQTGPNCFLNNQNYTKSTCSGTNSNTVRTVCPSSSASCGTGCSTSTDTNLDSCQMDGENYYYANSCGPSVTGVSTTTTTKSPNGGGGGGGASTTPSANGGGNGGNGGNGGSGSSNSASSLSASLAMMVASLIAYLL